MAIPQHKRFGIVDSRLSFLSFTATVIEFSSRRNSHGCLFTADGAILAASRDSFIHFGHCDFFIPLVVSERDFRLCIRPKPDSTLSSKFNLFCAYPTGVIAYPFSFFRRSTSESTSSLLNVPPTQHVFSPVASASRTIPSPIYPSCSSTARCLALPIKAINDLAPLI